MSSSDAQSRHTLNLPHSSSDTLELNDYLQNFITKTVIKTTTKVTAELQQKNDDLEIKVAFLDDTVEQLNRQLAIQNRTILDMQRALELLYQRVHGSDKTEHGIAPFDVNHDKPPHY